MSRTLLHRALSPAVAVLARRGVSPDVVTGLRLATGPGLQAVGAVVFLLSMLPDRADSALARRRQHFSRSGPILDLAFDCISTMAAFVGLGSAPPCRSRPDRRSA